MEKSVEWEFDTYMQEIFQMKEVDIREYSPLALAYIGDCIFDLVIKSLVMNEGNKQVQKMHKETSSYVQASAQSKMMRTIQEHLTEEEHGIPLERLISTRHLFSGIKFESPEKNGTNNIK